MSPIKRIGIVLKPNQPDALRTVCELVTWLNERSITLVGTPELERDRIENETGCPVDQAPGYLAKSLRHAPLGADEINSLLSRIDHYNDAQTEANWAPAADEAQNRIEVRAKWRFHFGDRNKNLHLKKV